MSGVLIEARPDGLEALGGAFARMRALGENARPIFDAIAQYGESSTRLRFKNQAGPDGQAWKPSKRAQKTGGQTLVHKARLLRSITHRATGSSAEWGSNVVYAGIHQFGGKINKLAFSSWLRLRTGKGGALLRQKDHAHLAVFAKATHKNAVTKRFTVGAHAITMPARPYLGVNEQDGREMLALANDAVDQAAQNRGGA
jgi:phage virion morphogenesis protein